MVGRAPTTRAPCDLPVACFGGAAKRLDIGKVADDRMRHVRRRARPFGIAHERRDGVTAAKQCVEHSRADVTGRTR